MLNTLRSVFSNDLAIDLGTANTLIYVRGRGIQLNEPSVVAIRRSEGGRSRQERVCAVGDEAKHMLGRTPENIVAIRPIRDGVVANLTATEQMLQEFFVRLHSNSWLKPAPRVLVCVPCGSTQVEKRAIKQSVENAGASKVQLMVEAMAAAIGAGMPIGDPRGTMVLDIGGGTSEIAVLSLNGIVYSDSVRVGGDKFDEAIINYVRRQYKILIGDVTAEGIKKSIGYAAAGEQNMQMEVRGRSLAEGVPRSLTLNSSEIVKALQEPLATIVQAVRLALEKTPPELGADVAERGMVLTGGGALLRNLDKLLMRETGLPVLVADDPLTCVARGGGRFLEMWDSDSVDMLLQED
ncbi:MAG: rod shape-determining protein [Candidatus Porifericomitaceae bacterium WSBS_2022_MAG_OTU9]